jgi:hypothetical protein
MTQRQMPNLLYILAAASLVAFLGVRLLGH